MATAATKKAAPRKSAPRRRPNPLGVAQDSPAPVKSDSERLAALEDQVLKLRRALAGMLLQNPQVQEALANKMIEAGEI